MRHGPIPHDFFSVCWCRNRPLELSNHSSFGTKEKSRYHVITDDTGTFLSFLSQLSFSNQAVKFRLTLMACATVAATTAITNNTVIIIFLPFWEPFAPVSINFIHCFTGAKLVLAAELGKCWSVNLR